MERVTLLVLMYCKVALGPRTQSWVARPRWRGTLSMNRWVQVGGKLNALNFIIPRSKKVENIVCFLVCSHKDEQSKVQGLRRWWALQFYLFYSWNEIFFLLFFHSDKVVHDWVLAYNVPTPILSKHEYFFKRYFLLGSECVIMLFLTHQSRICEVNEDSFSNDAEWTSCLFFQKWV